MSTATLPVEFQDLPDGPGELGPADDGKVPVWSWDDKRLIMLPLPAAAKTQRIFVHSGGGSSSGSGEGGGTTDHALLSNLSYAASGHTGFEASGTAAAAVAAHLSAANPHSQYLLSSAFVPPGSTTQVLFNNAGAFAGDAGLTYDTANDALTVAGRVVTGIVRPPSDSTTAFRVQNAASSSSYIVVDSLNGRVGIHKTPTLPFDVLGISRLVQSGSGYSTGYALSVQSSATQTYLEILNSGGAGFGAFFGMRNNDFELWNYQGGPTKFFNGATAGSAIVALTIGTAGELTAAGIATATKFQTVFSTYNGEVKLGGDALYQGRIFHDGASSGHLYIENSWDFAGAGIIFRTRTNGTPVVTTLLGSGYLGLGGVTPGVWLDLPAATSSIASLRVRAGTTVTAPNDGDVWNDGNAFAIKVNGTNAVNTDGGLAIWMQSSTTARPVGRLLWQYTDKTDATRASRGSVTAYYTSTEHKPVTWGANSGGALLSFYDVTTPIARQVLATGAGRTVDDVITALQALGLVKQS